jgi:hypothetical protein
LFLQNVYTEHKLTSDDLVQQHSLCGHHVELQLVQVQTLNDVSQRLQSSLADTTKAHQAERLKRDNLHKQVIPLLCLATLLALANASIRVS